eukprot:TRINITY_DN12964_c0_g1_i10.p3 TRINITY_DN12964_c0_g1~~TRINITY_DN12964_c0_g1_i10.p3  ORF type:complete len:121 (-),score=25.01 TRINITY_DN12964_c0_g1_i10:124-486(-)
MIILAMLNFLTLSKDEKQAFFDLTVSPPASMVVGSFFRYVQAKNSQYPAYNSTKASFNKLEASIMKFIRKKESAEVIAADIILTEEVIEEKLKAKLDVVKSKVNKLTQIVNNRLNHPVKP